MANRDDRTEAQSTDSRVAREKALERARLERYEKRQNKKGIIKTAVRIPSNRRGELLKLAAEWRRAHEEELDEK